MRTILLAALAIMLGIAGLSLSTAAAQPADAGVVIPAPPIEPDAGAADSAAPEPKPSEKLPDVIESPKAAYDAAKAAKKQGWAAAILAALVMLTAGFARASKKWPKSVAFAWFAKNKTALLILSGLSLVSCAAFDALVLGGGWWAVVWAAGGAALTLIVPTSAPAEAEKTEP